MATSFRAAIGFCFLLFVVSTHAQSNYYDEVTIDIDKIDQYLDAAAKQYGFNGVALITQKEKVLVNKGYGWRDVKSKALHDPSSIFQIASLTKQFTAAIILKLQQEGKLFLSDSINKFIPGYLKGDKITIYHLLTHTSGIPEYTTTLSPIKLKLKKTMSKENIMNIFEDGPLECEPGTQFRYSSSNYFLLGIIIEKITDKPYEQVVRQTIFEPLEMTNSGFDFRNLSSPARATGYSVFYNGRQTEAADLDSTILYSAGGIYSTTTDLYKWIKAEPNKKY